MNLKVSKVHFRRLRKVLKSTLNGWNFDQEVNAWAASLLRYSAAFISWRKCELKAIDRKARKLFIYMEDCTKSLILQIAYIKKIRSKKFASHEKLCRVGN